MKTKSHLIVLLLPLFLCGCSTSNKTRTNDLERGPAGTIAYHVQIESSEPGVRIEVNNDYIGDAPLMLKIFGDKDGTFHNFGSPEYVIRALPVKPGQYIQTKVFRTGGWFSPEDMIPRRIFFDMRQPTSGTGAAPPTQN